jgi:hypothetical protein
VAVPGKDQLFVYQHEHLYQPKHWRQGSWATE